LKEATSVAVITRVDYQCPSRHHGAHEYTTPNSYYHLPLPEIPNDMTPSPAYGISKLRDAEVPDYLEIDDN